MTSGETTTGDPGEQSLGFEWPDGADAVILPGVPGKHGDAGLPQDAYPAATVDIAKILGQGGLKVSYITPREKRVPVAQKSGIEFWGPILVMTQTAIAGGAGNLLSSAILELIGRHRLAATNLHVKVGLVQEGDRTITWFDGDGNASDVLDAMDRVFGRPVDGQGT